MIDMTEDFAVSSGADSSELDEFRNNVLPVLVYLQDACQIRVVSWHTTNIISQLIAINDAFISYKLFSVLSLIIQYVKSF